MTPSAATAPIKGAISLILASQSPRRHDLLRNAGWSFACIPSDAEEWEAVDADPTSIVRHNASVKAAAIARFHPHCLVIGADTIVALDKRVFHKPADLNEARSFLRILSGRTHVVHTGVALVGPRGRADHVFVETTAVTFRPLTEEAISEYLDLVHTLDKAGAYGAQEHGERIIAQYDGLFSNVMGLPIERLDPILRERLQTEPKGECGQRD
ncbi:MAG: septum formation protein Maf [Opitutales bacterium]|nr:septum formation protein Maf [Opitutales bacterium]